MEAFTLASFKLYVVFFKFEAISLSFILEAKSLGKYTIPGATIVIGNDKIKSNALEIQVVEPSEQEKLQKQKEKQGYFSFILDHAELLRVSL